MTDFELVALVLSVILLLCSAALLGYANGVADQAVRYAQMEANE